MEQPCDFRCLPLFVGSFRSLPSAVLPRLLFVTASLWKKGVPRFFRTVITKLSLLTYSITAVDFRFLQQHIHLDPRSHYHDAYTRVVQRRANKG